MPRRRLAFFLTACLLPAPAVADDGKFLGRFDDWEAFRATVGGQPVCYAATAAKFSNRKVAGRGAVVLMVSMWPKRKVAAQVKLVTGYVLKSDSEVELRFARQTYKLWTKGRDGWAADAKADTAIVKAMESGKNLRAVSQPAKGLEVMDRFSLTGFSKAWAAAVKACGKAGGG